MKKFVCVHGHFYQPPRENPWTGEVEEEPSAAPYHDWNERIAKECYEANARATILSPKGEAMSFVNNYELISFDIGPTLLSWLKRKSPATYRAILEADKSSAAVSGGHGNAIAQVYNHLIMPLAKKRDKITQIVWGIADFEHHYGRKPEGMWLSEAAVDRETLRLMADQGILYTVLAPHQAKRVRRLGFGSKWTMLHHEGVDTRRAYRIWLESGRQLHLFFYDAPVSRAVAFQGLLHSGDHLAHQLLNAFGHGDHAQLVSMAVDGETFGHHHRFGEMAVAYGLKKIREHKQAVLTNYGQFLEQQGSQWEADIFENSSWSCAHGVERWRSDCGCRMNHEAGWNQKWRTVLREAFDWLQAAVDKCFEEQCDKYLKDPWQTRNEYIRVILDPVEKERRRLLGRHAKRLLKPEEEAQLWRLLEAQKFSLFMYTSCGWFFDDISGIEPVQVMKFAARALELVQPFVQTPLEEGFLKILDKAKSNIPSNGTGKDIYERRVKTAQVPSAGAGLGATR